MESSGGTRQNKVSAPTSRPTAWRHPTTGVLNVVLAAGLKKDFLDVKVSLVDCPDLTKEPWNLPCSGLSGSPCLLDLGGPGFLLPLPMFEKYYDMVEVLSGLPSLSPIGMAVGAGAGPWKSAGDNSELVANFAYNLHTRAVQNHSRLFLCDQKDRSKWHMVPSSNSDCAFMVNLYCSQGLPGKVLEVLTAHRKPGGVHFVQSIKNALFEHYQPRGHIIGLGGVFILEKGKAKVHIMPSFSTEPLDTKDKVNEWLMFYDMDSPLVCFGELVSHDPGLNLRTDHFHCYGAHGEGGHFHYDVTPEDAQYKGYFAVCEKLYRVDKPEAENDLGKNFSK